MLDGTPTVANGWVRYFPKIPAQHASPNSLMVPVEVDAEMKDQLDSSVEKIIIAEIYPCGEHNCGRSAGSVAFECVADSTQDKWCCEGHSTGHLCRSCRSGYFWDPKYEGGQCVECTLATSAIFIAIPLLIGFVALVLNHPRVKVKLMANVSLLRERLSQTEQDGSYEGIQAARAIFRSSWQPVRILISYSQIVSQVSYNLDISFPAGFQKLVDTVQTLVVFTKWIPNAQCALLDSFLVQWIFSVVIVPGALLSIVLIDYLVNPKRWEHPIDARKDLLANLFFIVFFW